MTEPCLHKKVADMEQTLYWQDAYYAVRKELEALRAELAKPEQAIHPDNCIWRRNGHEACTTAQPAQEPLTDEQVDEIAGPGPDYFDRRVFARAIKAAHGIGGKA